MTDEADSPERYRMIADRLAYETGDTTENVIRKALALYWRALRANEAGQRLAILDADDVIVAEITNLTQPLPDDPMDDVAERKATPVAVVAAECDACDGTGVWQSDWRHGGVPVTCEHCYGSGKDPGV